MLKTGFAVIGAGYGDEGKGLMTDYLSRKSSIRASGPIVVRVNGGGQAGHTVVDKVRGAEGELIKRRHVFSHVGAGTLAGSSTFLSSRFIANPFVLHQELNQLRALGEGQTSRIEIHPGSQLTTPFDMALNLLKELSRGDGRHGSCGLGINETVTRQLAGYSLTVGDLTNGNLFLLKDKLHKILKAWVNPRLEEIDLSNVDPAKVSEVKELLNPDRAIETLSLAPNLFGNISTLPNKNHSLRHSFIFEGAQGLELDEFLGTFPYVTRSITGLPSALLAAAEVGVTEVSPVYVTRAYKTRHGAGPLPHEGGIITSNELHDNTNVENPWQGALRYAPLSINDLSSIISNDLQRSMELAKLLRIKVNDAVIAVTCLDQVMDDVAFYRGSSRVRASSDILLRSINSTSAFRVRYASYGPTAADVVDLLEA